MGIVSRTKALDLPVGKHLVFSRGVMEVHGTRHYLKACQFHITGLTAKAGLIGCIPFMTLEDYLFYKMHLTRGQDKQDVALMQNYLATQKIKT